MKERQERIEFHRNYCVHYQPREKLCGAGVDGDKLEKVATGPKQIKWGPCIGGNTLEAPLSACPHWQRRTLAEGEAYADAIEATLHRMVVVGPAIRAWREKLPIGKVEVIVCPACQGRLHLSQAPGNGHVRAKCETKGCIAFVE